MVCGLLSGGWAQEKLTPVAEPKTANMLYETGTEKGGFEDWSLTPTRDWRRLKGMLLNAGTYAGEDFAPIFAPYKPEYGDYAVEADIRVIENGYSFGVVVRANGKEGYAVGVGVGNKHTHICYLDGTIDDWGRTHNCKAEAEKVFDPGTDWHTYRIEVEGNRIRLLIDGIEMASVADNMFLSAGRVGLWSSKYQLEVRNFKVIDFRQPSRSEGVAQEKPTPVLPPSPPPQPPPAAESVAPEKRTPVRVEVKRRPIMIEGKTFLPLRVLARPFSNIYKESDTAKGTVEENVPTFQAYYVYTRPEVKATGTDITGWYEVGSDNRGTVLGWMRAEDVLEWKQNMSLAYTHPEGRKPVLLFEKREAVLDLVKAPSGQRKQRAEALYAAIQAKNIPPDFPVRSVEPNRYIDISTQFYLLPILEFGEAEFDQYETRILKLAAAVLQGGDAREPSPIKGNTTYLDQAVSENLATVGGEEKELLAKLEMDVVFVIDMTASMQPWINATLEAVRNVVSFITKDEAIHQSVHFGLWGYRDSLENPGMEFLTKNFTPTLQPVEAFVPVLQGVHEATASSGDFPEDVFSGVNDALTKTAWTPNALRFIVLVGDAPSHELGHPWNYSGQSAETLRQFANDHSVYIFALHAKYNDPRLERIHVLAEKQFRTLATNKGAPEAAYFSVNGLDVDAFAQNARQIAEQLVQIIDNAKKGQAAPAPATPAPGAAQLSPGETIGRVGHAALVEWLGRATETKAPRDIIAWAVDKDLLDPALPSMEVRLLINKREIDELRKVLQDVMTAGRKGQIGGEDFFKVLQTTAATVARGEQSRIRQAQSMAELVPDFLQGLPYKSQLMALSNDLWASWSTDQQDEFLKSVEAKINLYAAIHDTPDKWIQLHKGDAPDEFVYPLALDSLP
jgi:hypothetical protein